MQLASSALGQAGAAAQQPGVPGLRGRVRRWRLAVLGQRFAGHTGSGGRQQETAGVVCAPKRVMYSGVTMDTLIFLPDAGTASLLLGAKRVCGGSELLKALPHPVVRSSQAARALCPLAAATTYRALAPSAAPVAQPRQACVVSRKRLAAMVAGGSPTGQQLHGRPAQSA